MCTALTFHAKDHYFGRNLDLSYSYRETVTVTPRNYPLRFRKVPDLRRHHAIIGVAYVQEDYPLYYDAVNERGLAMAGLRFPNSAAYYPEVAGRDNVAPFELIPWLLGQCATVEEALVLLERMNLWACDFSDRLPRTPLHWLVADRERCIVLEPMEDGLHIHENPVGVLTNEPPFPFMLQHLALFRDLSAGQSLQRITDRVDLPPCSQGLAARGLPGDWSSPSRFVRAAFVRLNAACPEREEESVGQFFHLLGAVEMVRGCVKQEEGESITVYSACCNQDRGIYYYTTYENRRITAVDLHREDLEGCDLISYPLQERQDIFRQK